MADFAGSSLYNRGMPELPEVEIIKKGLSELLLDCQIVGVSFDWPKGFNTTLVDVEEFLIGAKILGVRRRAKVLMIDLSTKYSLVIHLKMTGQLVFVGSNNRFGGGHPNDSLVNNLPDKSTRVIFNLKSNNLDLSDKTTQVELDKARWQNIGDVTGTNSYARLFFNDQRKFGWVKLMPTAEINDLPFFKKLGPEPLLDDFSFEVFKSRLSRRQNSIIKATLLDQSVLAGIGNIYADEALFLAKIYPSLRVKDLKPNQIEALHGSIIQVLQLSIDKGGSSDRNYINAKGERGAYLDFAKVFRREGQVCYSCGHIIIKIRVAGRGTHICPNEQKLPKGYK